jgi:hypothetical protein
MRRWWILVCVGLFACSSADDSRDADPTVETASASSVPTSRTSATEEEQDVAPAATTARIVATEPASTTSPATDATDSAPLDTVDSNGANPLGGNDPEDALMPDVVCLNLQTAQDVIQDHGVFFSRSQDATGADRMQIVDRNWVVVVQSPAPGTPMGEGEAVLFVVKNDEPSPC